MEGHAMYLQRRTETSPPSKKRDSFFGAHVIQKKLSIGASNDSYEVEADSIADRVVHGNGLQASGSGQKGSLVQRKPLGASITPLVQKKGEQGGESLASSALTQQIAASNGTGQAMDKGTQGFMENRFGADFSGVKIHTGPKAARMSSELNAQAFAVGNDIYFNEGKYNPSTPSGKHLLAHELTHTIQQGGKAHSIQAYRDKGSFNFGTKDTSTLIEDTFDPKTDKETKPWIELVDVKFDALQKDSRNSAWEYSTGKAVINFYKDTVAPLEVTVTGGSGAKGLGRTDAGTFTVHRIEGVGYNSGKYSGNYDKNNREGPLNRYSKNFLSNMSFAVFYNQGEALHEGPLDMASHGCVHVDWGADTMQWINYHSVIGLTKVKVSY